MKLTKHARRQAQRRGISEELVELVIAYGDEIKGARSARLYRLPLKEMRFLAEECPPMLWRRYRDRLRTVTAVVDTSDAHVLTTMHRYKPLWKSLR